MTDHVPDPGVLDHVVELLTQHGLPSMARAFETCFNEAMKIERCEFLGAAPYERSEGRLGHANGFKPKSLHTRLGELALEVPQVRGLPEGVEPFYPRSLERGLRSERALKIAVAEMLHPGSLDAAGPRDHTEALRLRGELDASLARHGGARAGARSLAKPPDRRDGVFDPRCALREGAPRAQGGELLGALSDRRRSERPAQRAGSQRVALGGGGPLVLRSLPTLSV